MELDSLPFPRYKEPIFAPPTPPVDSNLFPPPSLFLFVSIDPRHYRCRSLLAVCALLSQSLTFRGFSGFSFRLHRFLVGFFFDLRTFSSPIIWWCLMRLSLCIQLLILDPPTTVATGSPKIHRSSPFLEITWSISMLRSVLDFGPCFFFWRALRSPYGFCDAKNCGTPPRG